MDDRKPLRALRNHAEIRYVDVRIRARTSSVRRARASCSRRRASDRVDHHCMRWLGSPARLRHDVRTRRQSFHPRSLLSEKQTVQNWIADSRAEMHAARLMTLHAPGNGQGRRVGSRDEIAMIKYYGGRYCTTSSTGPSRRTGRSAIPPTCPWRRCTAGRAPRIYDGPTKFTARPWHVTR